MLTSGCVTSSLLQSIGQKNSVREDIDPSVRCFIFVLVVKTYATNIGQKQSRQDMPENVRRNLLSFLCLLSMTEEISGRPEWKKKRHHHPVQQAKTTNQIWSKTPSKINRQRSLTFNKAGLAYRLLSAAG